MADDTYSLIVKLQADVAQLKSDLGEARGELSGFKSSAEDFGASIKSALKITAAALGIYELGSTLKNAFKQGIEAVDEFRLGTISVAAALTDLGVKGADAQKDYDRNIAYSKDMFNELELAAARHFAGGKDMVLAWNILAQKGVALRGEEIDDLGIIVDKIKLATQGQVQGIQVAQELRAMLSGQSRTTDQLAMILKDRYGAAWEEIVRKHREAGDLLSWLAGEFKGLQYASADVVGTLTAQKTTLETLIRQVGRGGLEGVYEDIVELLKKINDYLTEHKDTLVGDIAVGWATIKWYVKQVTDGVKELQKETTLLFPTKKEDYGFFDNLKENFQKAFTASPGEGINKIFDDITWALTGMKAGLLNWGKAGDETLNKWANSCNTILGYLKEFDAWFGKNYSWTVDFDTPIRELEAIKQKILYVLDLIDRPITWVINAIVTGLPSWMTSEKKTIQPAIIHPQLTVPDTSLGAAQEAARLKSQGITRIQLQTFGLTDIPNWAFPFQEAGAAPTRKLTGDTGKGGDKSRVSAWQAELEEMKVAENSFFTFSKDRELEFWRDKLEIAKAGGKGESDEYTAIQHKIFAIQKEKARDSLKEQIADLKLQQEFAKDNGNERLRLQDQILKKIAASYGKESTEYKNAARDRVKIAHDTADNLLEIEKKRIETEKALVKIDLDIARDNLATRRQIGVITAVQELSELMDLKRQEMAIERNTLKEKLAELEKFGKQYTKEYADIKNKLKILDKQETLEMQKLNNQRLIAIKQQWDQVWGSISRAFSQSLTGILQGTTTLADALKNIWQSILTSFVEMILQMTMQWVAAQLFQLIFGKTTAAGQIAQRSGPLYMENLLALVGEVGPWAAPVAAGILTGGEVAAAKTMSLVSAAGGWDVDHDAITKIHKREMVLPESIADRIRAMTGSDGGGGSFRDLVINCPNVTNLDRQTIRREIIPAIETELGRKGLKLGSKK